MRRVILAAALAALSAAPAYAQQGPPPPSAAQMQQMQQMHAQLEQIRRNARAQILTALSPAHKALLAQVAGNLATSASPNFDAAAARLDAALSPAEKSRIMAVAQSTHAQMRSMMANMPQHPGMREKSEMGGMQHKMPTAGGILLMLVAGHGPEHGMMMHP